MKEQNEKIKAQSFRDFNVDELKNFITSVQQEQKEVIGFKPERLKHFREDRKNGYSVGISN